MFSMGLDFGTNSVRCVILDLEEGIETACGTADYPSGDNGVITDRNNPHLARQNPADYHLAMEKAVVEALETAAGRKGFRPDRVIGLGVDTTGSTPLPVDEEMKPLSFRASFQDNPNAMAWLWKDHTAAGEAAEITSLARQKRPAYLSRIGGAYSSEWFFAKLLRLYRVDPAVFHAAAGFLELCDYIPALLTGKSRPGEAARSVCAAGHKAMYGEEWGGLPDREFLDELGGGHWLEDSWLYRRAVPAGEKAGLLCACWAGRFGLPRGIPVSVGAFDAHMGAVGAGVRPGVLVKVIGTSTCDMTVAPMENSPAEIPGICGIVPHSIIPGFTGIEAGQSGVGDIFNWFTRNFPAGEALESHHSYSRSAAGLKPGRSGLLALDWHNGNRNILADQELTGLVLGMTLDTRPEEIYRALVEATGFGARLIIERIEEHGVKIEEIVAAGGIPKKNPFLMSVYADITGRSMKIPATEQTCAVGAAIFGAIAAGAEKGGFRDVAEAQRKVCRFEPKAFHPDPAHGPVYDRLFSLYRDVHDAFGRPEKPGGLYHVMKELLRTRREVSGG